jgi:hypothetical protein
MLRKRTGRPSACVDPYPLGEVHMAIPETGNDGLSDAIDDPCFVGDIDFACGADRADNASRCNDHRIR